MTDDDEHLFMGSFAIHRSSLGIRLLKSSAHFVLLSCLSSRYGVVKVLYVLDTILLLDICLTNICFQSVAWLFMVLTGSFEESKFLISMKSGLSISPPLW